MSSSQTTDVAKPDGAPALNVRGVAGAAESASAAASNAPVAHGGRLLSLDILRAVAILLVLGRHSVAPAEGLGWFQPFAAGWHHIGWSGVDLFFVLSGFLVSGLIFAEYRRANHVNIGRFVIRRGFKIWPPYFVYIGFVACWLAWDQQHQRGGGSVWAQLWPSLLHVQNYFHSPRIQTWSLAVEEHFYLAVAVGFYLLLTRANAARLLRRFPTFVAVALGGLIALRSAAYLRQGPEHINLFATHLRFDGLLLGTLLAYYAHFVPERLAPLARRPVVSIVVGLLLATPTLWLLPEANVWTAGMGLSLMYVGYGLVLIGWMNLPNASACGRWLFATPVARWLGTVGFYSYSIYLWHLDLGFAPMRRVTEYLTGTGWSPGVVWLVTMPVYVAVAIATGALLAKVLELPSLALRDRLFPSYVKAVPVLK